MHIVDEVLRIDATLVSVTIRSYTNKPAEIVLGAPMTDEVARLVQQVGLDCTVGLYFNAGQERGQPPPEPRAWWDDDHQPAVLDEVSHPARAG